MSCEGFMPQIFHFFSFRIYHFKIVSENVKGHFLKILLASFKKPFNQFDSLRKMTVRVPFSAENVLRE